MAEQREKKEDNTVEVVSSNIIKNERRKRKKRLLIIRNTAITIICIALGVIISLQYKSLNAANKITGTDEDKILLLQTQQLKLIQENEQLATANEELQKKVALLESSSNEEQIAKLMDEVNKVKMFGGTTTVTGQGVIITIKLLDDQAFTKENSTFYITLQRHLLTIVNDLKAATAQAISINGERITAQTEIKVMNTGTVVINGQNITAPFEIKVIGNQSRIQSSLTLGGAGSLSELQSKQYENIYNVTIALSNEVTINACRPTDIATDFLENVT